MTEREFPEIVELPERLEAFEDLRNRLEIMTNRAELLGLEVHAVVEQSGNKIHKQADEPMFSASLGKLPLAVMAIENLEPHVPLQLDDLHGVDSGVSAAMLIEKMLKNSDNLSYRVLAEVLGGPEAVNEFYASKGWLRTRVKRAANGRTQIAESTPAEAIAQMEHILGDFSHNDLADVARMALSEQKVTRYGIRQLKVDDPRVHIFNKTGEYPGDHEDPFVFRHDVGSILGPNGRVSYAVMTAIPHDNLLPTPAKNFLANSTVKHIGAELINFVGGDISRRVGSLALKSS
jgi:hypothetical protein